MFEYTTMVKINDPIDTRVGGLRCYDLTKQLYEAITGNNFNNINCPLCCCEDYMQIASILSDVCDTIRDCVHGAYATCVRDIKFYSYPAKLFRDMSLVAVAEFEACPGAALFLEDMGQLTYFTGAFDEVDTCVVREDLFSELNDTAVSLGRAKDENT